ncbi:hypothetical protein PMG11_10736 [Penicillium brasilianum]|uniref:Uncharacterized protein n=1 Tax=Penicillium brasilianum TaxID=104259 RepID=A0A0F7U3G0_PENBI|nr:hypothetical protein PMG11_10736 [Penicillium brasilianum]
MALGQNGLAERTNRTIRERINTLLSDAKLPPSWWTELLDTVVYLKLRAPASILQKKTPYEVIYGKPPKLLHLRRIGSRVWVLIPKEHRAKIGPRSSKYRLLGYCEPNQYKLYEVHSRRTIFSRDIEFDKRTPIAPLIEGETGNDLPDNAPPSPIFPKPMLPPSSGPPTPPLSPKKLENAAPYKPVDNVPSDSEPVNVPSPVNPIQHETEATQDLGYSLYSRRRRPSRRLLESLGKVYATGTLNFPPGIGLLAKHGIDYHETFAAVSRMDSVRSIVTSAVLLAHGFTIAQSDNYVFYKPNYVVCVYVNDFLVAAADDTEIQQLQRALESEFKLNDLGKPRSFLGIQFNFHADGSISIHQHQYIQKVLSDFCIETYQPKSTPMAPKVLLNNVPDGSDLDEDTKARFGTAIGSLMYLMVGTRPNIAFALRTLSRFTSRPQSHHQAALQRLLRYIKATQFYRITYRSGQLIGYTDADFGGSVVTNGAYSTSGYVFKLTGAPVS